MVQTDNTVDNTASSTSAATAQQPYQATREARAATRESRKSSSLRSCSRSSKRSMQAQKQPRAPSGHFIIYAEAAQCDSVESPTEQHNSSSDTEEVEEQLISIPGYFDSSPSVSSVISLVPSLNPSPLPSPRTSVKPPLPSTPLKEQGGCGI